MTALVLAMGGLMVSLAPQFVPQMRRNNNIEFGAPVVGFFIEVVAIWLALRVLRAPSSDRSTPRVMASITLGIAIPLAILLFGCDACFLAWMSGWIGD